MPPITAQAHSAHSPIARTGRFHSVILPTRRILALALLLLATLAGALEAQWTHRYPKVEGYSHHVYLEGYELPILTSGPIDPAMSPDGRTVALAARGWIWLLDPASGEARRLTRSGGIDARPAWSPDGRTLAFVRDDGSDTRIMLIDLATGDEREAIDEPAIDLDPAFSADGRRLFYASAAAGDLDIWSLDLGTGEIRSRPVAKNGIGGIARCGAHVVVVSYDGAAYLVDPATLEVVNTLRCMTQRLQASALI